MGLRTPKGRRPWKNDARFDKNFNRLDLQGMNRVDASSMRVKAREYAMAYVHKLVYHGLPDPGGSRDCALCIKHKSRDHLDMKPDDDHCLKHIRKGTMPSSLILRALYSKESQGRHLSSSREEVMVHRCWSSKRASWRAPLTYEQALAMTEEKLMGTFEPRLTPIDCRFGIRELLENYLLLQLGFEITQERLRDRANGYNNARRAW